MQAVKEVFDTDRIDVMWFESLKHQSGIGKGNDDWNCSAPHGAGRIMSRSKAKEAVSLDDFKSSMEGIYTTSVNKGTLDESPFAYKPMEDIVNNIKDTVDIIDIIKPVYNFKASGLDISKQQDNTRDSNRYDIELD